jgi:hypothetical protein
MLSRKTTKSLAEVYHAMFAGHYDVTSVYGNTTNRFYSLEKDSLYDFLYEHDYDAWFLNAAKALPGKERDLKEFIMRLHTGEAVTSATPDWTWQQRSKLGQRLLKDFAEDVLVWSQTSGVYVRDTVKNNFQN